MIAIAALGAAIPFVNIATSKTESLPVESTNLPIVRLADIEQNPKLVREVFYSDEDANRINGINYNWSLFAPLQYESSEAGIVPGHFWNDGSGEYSPSIRTHVYKLAFPSMIEGLISDYITKNDLLFYAGEFIPIESKDFDALYIREFEERKEVFAAKGKGLIYVSYFGYATMDVILKSVEEKLDLIAE